MPVKERSPFVDKILNGLYLQDLEKIDCKDFNHFFNKSFFISGGIGLIGSTIVDFLCYLNLFKNANIKIYIGDINKKEFYKKYSNVGFVSFVYYDSTTAFNLDLEIDFIVNCAGIANPKKYVSNPVETFLSHAIGNLCLLEYCKNHSNTKMIYISSSEVYGNISLKEPFKEDDIGCLNFTNVRSSYAEGKRASELLCKSFFEEYKTNVVICRPGHIYGPNSLITDTRISSAFCYDAVAKKDLVLKSAGLQLRSYCYCVDCAYAILFLLINGKPGEPYNIGSNRNITIKQMAEIIASYSGVKVIFDINDNEEKAHFNPMEISALDSSKLLSLGFNYKFNPKEGFEHTLEILKGRHSL